MKIHLPALIRRTLFVLFSTLIVCPAMTAIAAPARVAILPFDMHAEKDLTFLQEGIIDMLGSRIAYKDQVEVISKSETRSAMASVEGVEGESRALLVGGKLKADYVLFGSITMFGQSVSIDAKMVDVTSRQAPLPFFTQTQGMGDVIPQINQFATNINETVFGRAAPQSPPAAASTTAGAASSPSVQPAPVIDPRMHPEKLLKQKGESIPQVQKTNQGPQPPNSEFQVVKDSPQNEKDPDTFWKSRNFKMLITGMDIGDIDNDGQQEIVVTSTNQVHIFRSDRQRKFIKIAETPTNSSRYFVGVDIGDINNNGIPEIFVSGTTINKRVVDSIIYEFTDNSLKMIADNQSWFYRVVRSRFGGEFLIGQQYKRGQDSIFNNPIYLIQASGSSYTPGKRLSPGGNVNVLGASYEDLFASGKNVLVCYDSKDRLRIYSSPESAEWVSEDRSGGNNIFFQLPRVEPGTDNIQYYPLRVRCMDLDNNGKVEILVALHDDLFRSMTTVARQLRKGRIESLSWDGLGLKPQWRTKNITGRISDFLVGDFDNDGDDELVAAVVMKEGAIIGTDAVSSIIAYNLDQIP